METVIFSLVVGFIGYKLADMENRESYVHGYVCNLFMALGVILTLVFFWFVILQTKKVAGKTKLDMSLSLEERIAEGKKQLEEQSKRIEREKEEQENYEEIKEEI